MKISINEMLLEIESLPIPEKLELVERVVHDLKNDQLIKNKLDWDKLYGLGKGIWNDMDAQDYVNGLREDR